MNNIIGFICFLIFKHEKVEFYHGAVLAYHTADWGGLSIGIFTFVGADRPAEWVKGAIPHEFGHTLQSLLLGPFYMFVIGIPSMLWAQYWISKKRPMPDGTFEIDIPYDKFYPESWANAWGCAWTKDPIPEYYGQTQASIDKYNQEKAARLAAEKADVSVEE